MDGRKEGRFTRVKDDHRKGKRVVWKDIRWLHQQGLSMLLPSNVCIVSTAVRLRFFHSTLSRLVSKKGRKDEKRQRQLSDVVKDSFH